jgi:hypothetical protein
MVIKTLCSVASRWHIALRAARQRIGRLVSASDQMTVVKTASGKSSI